MLPRLSEEMITLDSCNNGPIATISSAYHYTISFICIRIKWHFKMYCMDQLIKHIKSGSVHYNVYLTLCKVHHNFLKLSDSRGNFRAIVQHNFKQNNPQESKTWGTKGATFLQYESCDIEIEKEFMERRHQEHENKLMS